MNTVKLFILGCAIAFAPYCSAQNIYSGFPEYYSALPSMAFKRNSGIEFERIKHNKIAWNGISIKLNKTFIFPNETVKNDDLGPNPVIYQKPSWACIEGRSSTSSGTSVRHFAIYLVDLRKKNRPKLFKLPSLFGTCLGIRLDDKKRFVFDSASYLYEKGIDDPSGLMLKEYRISDIQFIPTGNKFKTQFIELGNVWKFIIEPKQEPVF